MDGLNNCLEFTLVCWHYGHLEMFRKMCNLCNVKFGSKVEVVFYLVVLQMLQYPYNYANMTAT